MRHLELRRHGPKRGEVLRERQRWRDQAKRFAFYEALQRQTMDDPVYIHTVDTFTRQKTLWFQRYAERLNRYGDALFREREIGHPRVTQHR